MADPWMKFYPADWRADPKLRMCSLMARGLWMEMLAIMHEATPRGFLLVSGKAPTDAQLAVLAGAPLEQVTEAIGELEATGVFSRTREGVIYSRRMTRDAKKAATARKNGKNGGNPRLRKETGNPPLDNPSVKGGVKPQKPDARESSVPIGTGADAPGPASPLSSSQAVWQSYPHKLAAISGKPEAKVRTWMGKVLKEHSPEAFSIAAEAALRIGTGDPFAYIVKALQNIGTRSAPRPGPAPKAHADETHWRWMLERYRESGFWTFRAYPSPESPECPCPAEILAEFGIERRAA
jgi:hypothetical protein